MTAASGLAFSTSIQYVPGVGPARARAFQAAGIETVEDLLSHFPRRYLDRTRITPIRALQVGEVATVVGTLQVCGERPTRRRKLYQAVLSDGTGNLKLVWFQGIPYVKKSLKVGDRLAVYGKVEFYNGYQLVHPEYDKLNEKEDPLSTGRILPIYPLTGAWKQVRLEQRALRKIIHTILEAAETAPDIFPPSVRAAYHLVPREDAFRWVHFPEREDQLTRAVFRFKFEEHFFLQLLMALRRRMVREETTRPLDQVGDLVRKVYRQIPFELSDAQKRVLREIRQDLARPNPMNRLLQGDVGSGKTVVALVAAAIAVENGAQVAVMAPTEILAQQHYRTFRPFLDSVQISCALLLGKTPVAEREKILQALRHQRLQVIVGTHALIQEDVEFARLGLVIIDEQHRFGVLQRGTLLEKGYHPHVLAMTATPIPRTLALTYHGDMEVSIIDELPRDRQPVVTRVVPAERLPKVYQFMREEIRKGRQCMVVYPLVEESEKSDLKAAVAAREELQSGVFRGLSVGLLHGKMKKPDKDAVMEAFARNEVAVLVATTVIEVGIDVPNATVMLIEHAERFGLTQLHQLRGRVGRGREKGYCILVHRGSTD
ncbi:MAG: ATP-dependent DNA helicase RecG, partial [Candidatus Neomarinimicrobiota bacterium]